MNHLSDRHPEHNQHLRSPPSPSHYYILPWWPYAQVKHFPDF